MKKILIAGMVMVMGLMGLTGCGENNSANVTESKKTRIDVLDYVEDENDDEECLRIYLDVNGEIKTLEFHVEKEGDEIWIEH